MAESKFVRNGPEPKVSGPRIGCFQPNPPDETTVFPQYHRIDYVRIYRREQPGTYFVTTAAHHGRVRITPPNPENRYAEDSSITLHATPSIGWRFSSWQGDAENTNNPLSITVTRHRHIVANFVPDPDPPQSLSRGVRATASSIESDKLTPDLAVDGDRKTRWSSQFTDPQWLQLDLERNALIEAFRIFWEIAYARKYRIELSADARNWTAVHEKTDGHGGVEEIIRVNRRARYVRLVGLQRATEWGHSLWEFEVYGRRCLPNRSL